MTKNKLFWLAVSYHVSLSAKMTVTMKRVGGRFMMRLCSSAAGHTAKYCHFFRSCQRCTSVGISSLKHWLRQYWQLIVHARAWIRKRDGSQSAIDEAMICVLLGTILLVWLGLFSLAFCFGFYCKSKDLKKDVICVKIFFYYKGSPLKVMFKGVQHV